MKQPARRSQRPGSPARIERLEQRRCLAVRIVADNPLVGEVPVTGAYVQTFDSLPASGSVSWVDDTTLNGWYANLTQGQVSTGSMTATAPGTVSAVTVGSVGTQATLNSLGASGSANRALGGTPSAYATGSSNLFSSKSVNVALRVKNATGGVLTGLKVAYDTIATATTATNGLAFAYKVFAAGSGTISTNFIETHEYLNTYNGVYNESMRTEFGRRISSTDGWTAVVKDIVPASSASRTGTLTHVLRDLAVNPGDEVWLAWHIARENSGTTTTAIDNVTLSEFTVGRPTLPVITTHPRDLAVATGLLRDATLSVVARGSSLTYQWRKNGVPILGAAAATYALTDVTSALEGSYDVVVSSAAGSVTSLPARVNSYGKKAITTVNDVSFAAYSSGISQLQAASGGTLCDLYYPTTLPTSTTKVPAVIVIHGGGGNNGDKSDTREVEASQELAARGWFVMTINYAMSSSTQQCWPYNLWDAKQAVRWLKQKADAGTYNIDKTKIGVVGFSWGCNLGSMLAMTGPGDDVGVSSSSLKVEPPARGNAYDAYSTDVQCSAVFYGATDLPNYHQMNQFLNYTAWDNRTLYRRASPINYPNANAAPMLVAHGSADDDVWQSQTEATYHMQRTQGARLEPYLQVPGGEHSFGLYDTSRIAAGFPNPIDVRPETIGFLEKYLVETTQRPAILAEPVSKTVAAGGQFTLSVRASGSPAPTYQWRKDGSAIAGATSATYTTTAGGSTPGWYDVVVTNAAGSVTTTAALVAVSGAVTPVPPQAGNDAVTTPWNTAIAVNVLGNDSDSNGDPLTISAVTQGQYGSVVIGSGVVTYTPFTGYVGADSFTYTISDGNGGTATATVTVAVEAMAAAPLAAEATVESGTNAANDVDEANADATGGYVAVKFSTTGTRRKAYFQFDVSNLAVKAGGAATFTLRFKNSYTQRVQLWALNESYASFAATATWNTAQANDTTGNGMLASGALSATAIGDSVMLQPGVSPYTPATFTIPNVASFVRGGRITFVVAGADVTPADTTAGLTNNASGARFLRAQASLSMPVIDTGVYVAAGQTVTSSTTYSGSQQLVKRGPGTLILATGNSHSGGTVVEAGRVVVANIVALGSGGLRVANGGRLVADVGTSEIRVSSLVVEAGGGIDLGAGRITVAAGGFTTAGIVALITAGLNGGDWAGTSGITSGLAATTPDRCVGYAPNDDGSLTVAFAASGDTNLDGLIDTLDIANIAAAGLFDAGIATAWWQGDINYDGFIDILDLSALLGSGLYDEASYLPSGLSAREAAFADHDARPPA